MQDPYLLTIEFTQISPSYRVGVGLGLQPVECCVKSHLSSVSCIWHGSYLLCGDGLALVFWVYCIFRLDTLRLGQLLMELGSGWPDVNLQTNSIPLLKDQCICFGIYFKARSKALMLTYSAQ